MTPNSLHKDGSSLFTRDFCATVGSAGSKPPQVHLETLPGATVSEFLQQLGGNDNLSPTREGGKNAYNCEEHPESSHDLWRRNSQLGRDSIFDGSEHPCSTEFFRALCLLKNSVEQSSSAGKELCDPRPPWSGHKFH